MQRRNFLIGMGSIAAGGAAVVGSGATSVIRADRGYKVDVAGDADAYLGLNGNTDSPFVNQSDGTLSLDFASDTEDGGEGVNIGVTEARPAFELINQGAETMYVQVENPLSNNDITTDTTGNAADEATITVPAGVDFQFIATPSGDANNLSGGEFGVIGRQSTPSTGPTFGSTTGQKSIRKHPGATGYNFIENAGHVELDPGQSVDVITRVIATEQVNPPEVDFTVEAFSDAQWASGDRMDFYAEE
ncbi:hypothetical protein GJ631_08775 [Natronomonas sp. CBA1123]|uniref:hypothetical protein n=1 Tax=Natronomonas sp. CBA1123 TaxID=2668070 RepID=UPI0012EA1623|nr:hypothetical protein [Natronomonas sp. CBA1123]MUV86657.1 hypothetical protein [Natronomonas sp. CBA1123]